jgi:hypothetical protein
MRYSSVLLAQAKLNEVVLYSPVEAVLAPFIEEAPSPGTKKWFSTNFKNWLLKQQENLYKLPYLPRNATEQQKKAFSYNDLYDLRLAPETETMIQHILDFFRVNPNIARLERMSVQDVVRAADAAVASYNKRIAKQGDEDDPAGVHTLMSFPGDYRVVELTTQKALDREGRLMGHCVGSLHGRYIQDGSRRIFSLRDPENMPHATIEVLSSDLSTTEIKGRSNAPPIRRYWPMLQQFMDQAQIKIDADHENLGLLRIPNPDTGAYQTMTTDQFRDMLLDPNNSYGQKLLHDFQRGGGDYYDDDVALGLFNALYGTDQLSDLLIQAVFSRMPQHGIQTVQHFGNRFTPQQLLVAFSTMRPNYGDIGAMYKTLLIATKPDLAMIKLIMQQISERGDRDGAFVAAVAQVMPDVYRQMIADPAVMERELSAKGARAAGPFFALLGTDQLNDIMIERAFMVMPMDALKRMRRVIPQPNPEQFLTMVKGSAHAWFRFLPVSEFTNQLLAYAKPDRNSLETAFKTVQTEHGGRDYGAALLIAAKQQVPDSLDKKVAEEAILAIDKDETYADFLRDDPKPSLRIQKRMLEKAIERGDNIQGEYLHYLRSIDTSIFKQIYQLLKPAAVSGETQEWDHQKQTSVKRAMNDKENAEARGRARIVATHRFLELLKGALQEPTESLHAAISQDGYKYQQGKAAFTKLGKSHLFDVAVKRLNRQNLIRRIKPEGSYRRDGDSELFQQNIDVLTAKEIVNIIGYNNEWFGYLVDAAPYRVPEVLAIGGGGRGYGLHPGIYGKFDFPVIKEKAFESLEAVWASSKVPENVKDDYTLKVMKRFKPRPADLLRMLQQANNADTTRYILKKTKRPSAELIRLVLTNWPMLMVDIALDAIPDALLVAVFREQPKVAIALMDRDLRDFGTDSRSRWASGHFRGKIDRGSAAFARYAKAAEAAGMTDKFLRYAREGELEDMHDEIAGDTVNLQLVRQHLDEFSIRSLVHFAHEDDTGNVMKLYFQHFDAKKLARLLLAGVFRTRYSWHDNNPNTVPKLDPKKLRDAMIIALKTKSSDSLSRVLKEMVQAKFPFDDALIMAALQSSGSDMRASLIAQGSDKVKDWVADNRPQDIDDIVEPTAHVIKVLFDKYAKIVRNYKGEITVSNHFSEPVLKWFSTDDYWFEYRHNPKVAQMLLDEAKRRGAEAIFIIREMLKHVVALKRSGEHQPKSYNQPIFKDLPSGFKVHND